jgi:hypothetical protein
MKGKSLLIGSAALILASGPISQLFAQSERLDVTMRVLDEVSDVDGVILSIDPAPVDEEPDGQLARNRTPEAATDESAFPAPSELGLESDLDREEDSEGEIEDFDVPEDIELPEEVDE